MEKNKKHRSPHRSSSSSCFVPGCKSGYVSTRKKNKSLGQKNPTLFSVKNQEELERWRKAVQRHYKELKIGDKICELHFTQDEIIRHYETLLPDGTVWRIERSRVNLKNGAVPTIFPDSQNVTPCANNSQTTKQPNSQNVEPCATNFQSTYQLNAQNSPRKRKFSKSFNNAVTCTKVAKSYAKILPKSKENNLNENPKHSVVTVKIEDPEIPETIANENFEQPRIVLNEMTETFTYSTLVMSLELLSKPSLLWGITEQDEYVMCANWDEDSTLMKRVIIDRNLKIQVFLKNRAIDFDDVKINNIMQLSSILHEVDRYNICVNANKMEKTGCDGYVLLKAHGNQCRYCQLIGNSEISRKTNTNFYFLTKGRNFTKHQILYDRIDTLKNNNALLKAQINKIMKIKAVWKLSSQTNQNPTTR